MPLYDVFGNQISSQPALAAVDGGADYVPAFDASTGLPVKVLMKDIRTLDYYEAVITGNTIGSVSQQNFTWHMPYAFFVTDVRLGMRVNLGTFTSVADVFRDAVEPITNNSGLPTGGTNICSTSPVLGNGNIINITGSGNTAAVVNAAQANLTDGCYMRVAVSFVANAGSPTTTNWGGLWVKLIGYRA